MTVQQINLYLPELRPQKEWLTAHVLAALIVGFTVLLALSAFVQKQRVQSAAAQLAAIEAHNTAFDSRIKAFMSRPRALNAVQLDQELQRLRREIAAREQIGLILRDQNLGNAVGFSSAMRGLAQQSSPIMALRRIRVSRGGSFVELLGNTRQAEEIPRYLQRLQSEPAFAGAQFGLLSVRQNSAKRGLHDFALGFAGDFQAAGISAR